MKKRKRSPEKQAEIDERMFIRWFAGISRDAEQRKSRVQEFTDGILAIRRKMDEQDAKRQWDISAEAAGGKWA